VYSGHLGSASAITGLTRDTVSAMRSSMAMAHSVIGRLPGEQSGNVRDAVNRAFLDGLQVSALVCAGIALAAAVGVAWLLPARPRHEDINEFNWDQLEREIR
jgi:hypothetical protein